MAENGAHCELPQWHLAAKEQHNGQSTPCRRGRESKGTVRNVSLVLWKKPLDWTWSWRCLSVCVSVPCVQHMLKSFMWCAYWVGLGNLSSVGLGTAHSMTPLTECMQG
uniref:Uncharacterized protein n=1 Tax=Oncorhynchus kisutch TaxID=8019 RepID=A0A8C7G6B5_ONCKI